MPFGDLCRALVAGELRLVEYPGPLWAEEKLVDDKWDMDAPGEWGTAGSIVSLRIEVDSLVDQVTALHNLQKNHRLSPELALGRIARIEECLKILKVHALHPTANN
jgi:hypothetical protein